MQRAQPAGDRPRATGRYVRKHSGGAMTAGVLLVALYLSACGGSSHAKVKWGEAVVKVGRRTITKPMLAHWLGYELALIYNEEPAEPEAKNTNTEAAQLVSCVHTLASTSTDGAHKSPSTLRKECVTRNTVMQNKLLTVLVTDDWILEEGRLRGVHIARAEIDKAIAQDTPSRKVLKESLAQTGQSEADLLFLVETLLLVTALQKKVASAPGLTAEGRARAEGSFAGTMTSRWTPHTLCKAGYVTSLCENFKHS